MPSRRKVGKGGVAIMWHVKHNDKVTPLTIDDDRIIGIHVHVSASIHLYILQVYLPCSNHPTLIYNEYIEKLENLISIYCDKGIVVIMGDINAHLPSTHFRKPVGDRGVHVLRFLNANNLVSANTLEMCTGARSSYVSPGGIHETLIDHIILPVERVDTIVSCGIVDDDALNVSRHRPVHCCIAFPHFDSERPPDDIDHINWKKVTPEAISAYAELLKNHRDILFALSLRIQDRCDIDRLYDCIVHALSDAADIVIPKSKFLHFLKPYWNSDLQTRHVNMKSIRKTWILEGRPRGDGFQSYTDYKQSKKNFRNLHRNCVANYVAELNSEIDNSAEFDRNYFWRLVKSRRKTCSSPGVEMMFGDIMVREPMLITKEWGNYFRKLYEQSDKTNYSREFRESIDNQLTDIKLLLSSDDEHEYVPVSDLEVQSAIKTAKLGKAAGIDSICYEHLKYGGECVEQVLCKLYSAMLRFGYTPSRMKKGIIITLFKGGRKTKHDPNNYRAITLGSVVLKLYERVLLNRMENQIQPKLNQLQGGFRKRLGCMMTSFTLRESINFAKENGSKLFVCFLDVRKAFDCVWHSGLFVKLFQYGIKRYELKSMMDLYDGMFSCVRNRGYESEWLHVLQGTRQGGVCSPFLYLVFIDELICKLETSGYGFNIHDINISCPTVADDMMLMSLSKIGLQRMMDICYKYSCNWRYDYNASKSAIVVYNESKCEYRRSNRNWILGDEIVPDKEEYLHLGIVCDKYLSDTENVKQCNTKLRGTFLSLSNSGLGSNDLHPLTSKKLYNTVVLTKAVYGCEMWNSLSSQQVSVIERGHRFCVKVMQNIPLGTRTDIALSVIGQNPLQSEIDRRKLMFFGQLCLLPTECVANQVFINRLIHCDYNPARKRGFFPDIYRLLRKYSLLNYLHTFINDGVFVSKFTWKRVVSNVINTYEETEWKDRMSADETLCTYKDIHTQLKPCDIWEFSKRNPKYSKQCKTTMYVLCKLYDYRRDVRCLKCGMLVQSISEHIIIECAKTEQCRLDFWRIIYVNFGITLYTRFISLSVTDQIQAMFSGYRLNLSDNDIQRWYKTVIFTVHSMWLSG
ncbi:MAG: reverse transcriptase family protein [Sedimenticola sp.]